jgi:hypothetical protein
VRGVEPGDAAAPAKARDAEPAGVAAVRLRPRDAGIEVTEHLGVGHLRDDRREQRVDVGRRFRIALADEELGRDREVAELGEAPRDVGDVGMDAEDLGDDEDDRKRAVAFGRGAIRGHREAGDVDRDLAGDEAARVRADRVCRDRSGGGGEADAVAARCAGRRDGVELGSQHRWFAQRAVRAGAPL